MTILCLKKKGQWIFFTLILKLFRVLFITYWFCVLKAVKDRFCSKLQKCEYNSNLQLPKPAPVLHPAQAGVFWLLLSKPLERVQSTGQHFQK